MCKKLVPLAALMVLVTLLGAVQAADVPPVTDGLELQFDATVLADLEIGAGVTQWPDSSANGRNATGGNGDAIYGDARTPSGLYTVSFHNSFAEALQFDYNPNDKDMTIVAVTRSRHEPAGWPQYHQGFIGWGETGGHGLTAPGAFNVTQTFIMMSGYSDTGPGHNVDVSHDPVTDFTLNVSRLDSATGVMDVYRDGVLLGELTDITHGIQRAMAQGHIAGLDFNGGMGWDGDIAEILVYSRGLSDSELAEVEDYLYEKWLKAVKAREPVPADGAEYVTTPLLQWTPGDTAVKHSVYFGTTPELGPESLVAPQQVFNMYYHVFGFEPGTTYYWRVDEIEADGNVQTGELWSFTAAPLTAHSPQPRNGAKWMATDTDLAWTAGMNAAQHELYFSTNEADVAAGAEAAFQVRQSAMTFDLDDLAPDTTYYWRVDEIAGDGSKQAGAVWSFTTLGPGGGIKGEYFDNMTLSGDPAVTRIDAEVNFNWPDGGEAGTSSPDPAIPVNLFSARWTGEIEIVFTDTYTFTTNTDDGARLWVGDELLIDQWVDQGPTEVKGKIELEAGQVYPIRMEYYENGGGAVAQLYWQSPTQAREILSAGPLQPPLRARAPFPANDAADTAQDLTLTWGAGEKAAQHDVYFGTDAEAVANATPADTAIYRGRQALEATGYAVPVALEWNTTYYWRIDEVNDAEPESPWQGSVWNFTTADFIIVDDFESYTNEVGNRVFQVWIDGLGYTEPAPGNAGNGTGALVGHDIWSPDSPYFEGSILETANVHGGGHAMPLYFGNAASPYVSEAERTWATGQNWMANGVTDLSLWFHGNPAGFVQNTPDSFTVSASGADIWGTADQFRYVYKSLNGDGSIVAKVESLEHTNDWAKCGVMIRESLDAGSKHAMVVVTPANGIQFTWRDFSNADMTEHNTDSALAAPYWVKLTRTGNTFTAAVSLDGATWEPIIDADGSTREITMIGSVYIGLALTSHNAGAVTVAEYSGVQTSGGVSGQWQVAEVGVDHPENDVADLYVRLQDTSGRSATVRYPEGAVVRDWTEWKISLADFAGVNLSAVKKMVLGVGNPNAPAPDGSGVVFYDDITVVKPAPEGEGQ